jgi:cobalt-zinc-cadmium efflux system protein
MLLALAITLGFMLLEAASGVWANSLALITDAVHNLTDVVALALSWYAMRLALRPAHAGKTYGYHRAGILVALVNSSGLIGIALFIFYEAYRRLSNPVRVEENVLIVVAAVAFVVNLGTAWLLHRDSEHDLNVRSAFVHLAGDALSTLAAFAAGILIAIWHVEALDPLVSILIGLLILWSGLGIVRETVSILLEGTPSGLDIGALLQDVLRVQGVRGVHDLHVWSLSQDMRALSAHVLIDDVMLHEGSDIQRNINGLLANKYGIAHSTLQLECAGCEPDLLYCDLSAGNGNRH